MRMKNQSALPKWVVFGTALAGLVAALLVVVIRYYEIRKARAEADTAEAAKGPAASSGLPPATHSPPNSLPTAPIPVKTPEKSAILIKAPTKKKAELPRVLDEGQKNKTT